MPALTPIRWGSSPEGTPKRPLVSGRASNTPTGDPCDGTWTGGLPVGVMDGLTPTAAWSASRRLFTAYIDPFFHRTPNIPTPDAVVDTLYDQSGNLRNISQNFDPDWRPGMKCDVNPASLEYAHVVNDQMLWTNSEGTTADDFITVSEGYMICSVKPLSFLDGGNDGYGRQPVMLDGQQNAGLTVGSYLGVPYVWANNWTGGLTQASAVIAADTAYVFEWRHQGGVLYLRVNGAGEVSSGSGNTQALGQAFGLGGRFLTASYDGLIYEAATFNVVPNLATRDALVQAFGTYVGAAV